MIRNRLSPRLLRLWRVVVSLRFVKTLKCDLSLSITDIIVSIQLLLLNSQLFLEILMQGHCKREKDHVRQQLKIDWIFKLFEA